MKRSNAWVRHVERRLRPWLRRLEGRPHPEVPAPAPRKILICKTCCLGDAVLSLYAIRAFKLANPAARLEVLCTDRIREVYADAGWIDAVHVLPVTGRRLARELVSLHFLFRLAAVLRRLRKARFDWFIDLELYRGYGPGLKRLLGIPYSRGFHVEELPPPAHDAIFFRGRHQPEWRCFFGVFGLEAPPIAPAPLYARETRPAKPVRSVGVVFGSSFNWPEKKWPLERFAALLSLVGNPEVEFVLFGSNFEAEDARSLLRAAPGQIRSTVGDLDFAGLKREVGRCQLVFGNDTGTMHVAAAAGIPTLTLFGPTSPEKWKPLGGEALYLEDLACRPCYYLGSMPDCSHHDCLQKLPTEKVAQQIRKMLAADAPET